MILYLKFWEIFFELDVVIDGASDVRSEKRKETSVCEERLFETVVQETIVALDDFLEISDFIKIFFQFMIILLDNFFTEIVAESFDEGQNSMVEFVSILEALHLSEFFERLEHDPAFT